MRASLSLLLSIVLLASLFTGCATANQRPHLEVPTAPTVDAPFEERAAYYKRYALQSREGTHLFLHGGDRVYWPEDLRPAVDEDSPTAKAIADHAEARARMEQWSWLAYGSTYTTAGGLALVLGGLTLGLTTTVIANNDKQLRDLGSNILLGGVTVGGVVAGVGLVGIFVNGLIVGEDDRLASEAADRAARTYPQALTDRLGVGVDANGLLFDLRVPKAREEPAPEGAGDRTDI